MAYLTNNNSILRRVLAGICYSACLWLLSACGSSTIIDKVPSSTGNAIVSLQPQQRLLTRQVGDSALLMPTGSGLMAMATTVRGLVGLDSHWRVQSLMPGRFSELAIRPAPAHQPFQQWLMMVDHSDQSARLVAYYSASTSVKDTGIRIQPNFVIDNLCLYQSPADDNLYVFLLDGEGAIQQWLLAPDSGTAQLVRQRQVPPHTSDCVVDDYRSELVVSETDLGVWRFPAEPESEWQRRPLAMRQPYGRITGEIVGVSSVAGGLIGVLTRAPSHFELYPLEDTDQVARIGIWPLTEVRDGRAPHLQLHSSGTWNLMVYEASSDRYIRYRSSRLAYQPSSPADSLPVVAAISETQAAPLPGDEIDDPAIWVDVQDPMSSLIIGIHKRIGLVAYGLNGQPQEAIIRGRFREVDLRQGVVPVLTVESAPSPEPPAHDENIAPAESSISETVTEVAVELAPVDLIAASNSGDNSIALFALDPLLRQLQPAGNIPTNLHHISGLCLYQPVGEKSIYAFVNDESGHYQQYRLLYTEQGWQGELRREFKLNHPSQGCVADDRHGRLYVGEQGVGVWWLAADDQVPLKLRAVARIGNGGLEGDIDGVALYHRDQKSFLLLSDRTNDAYVVVEAQPPFHRRGAFRVGLNGQSLIDGASGSTGLEVSSASFGSLFPDGLVVLQDDRNMMPDEPQNYKLVPWHTIESILAPVPKRRN